MSETGERTFSWPLALAMFGIVLAVGGIIAALARGSIDKIVAASFSGGYVEGEEGRYLSLRYDGLPDEGRVGIKKIQGEDILVRVWLSGGTWEDYTFSGEVNAYDELLLLLPEDETGYNVYYKNQEARGMAKYEG